MTKPVTIPNTFATATSSIPLANLDADFTAVANSVNDANTYSNFALDTGAANAYVVTFAGLTTTYSAGLRIQFLALNANTGASTLNVNTQGFKNILFQDGTALTANAILANAIIDVMYDGTQFLLMGALTSLPIPASQGGTGRSTLTANALIVGNGTGQVQFVSPGAATEILISNGSSWISGSSSLTIPPYIVIPIACDYGGFA